MRQRVRLSAVVLALTCLTLVVLGVSGADAAVRVTLRPGAGGPRTSFVLRFRNPVRTGTVAGVRRVERIVVSSPSGQGCVSSLNYALRAAGNGAAMRTVIRPGGRRHWCTGRFRGWLLAYQSTGCSPRSGQACPLLLIAPQTLARFNFRVSTTSSGGGSAAQAAEPEAATRRASPGLPSATTGSTTPVHGSPRGGRKR